MTEIEEVLNTIRPDQEFKQSNNFILDGLLDSMDLIRVVMELNKKFNISIDAGELLPESFDNLENLDKLISKYTSYN